MSQKLFEILNEKENEIAKEYQIEYSKINDVLYIFTGKTIKIISNVQKDEPKIKFQEKCDFKINNLIIHPKNENQLLLLDNNFIYFIQDLENFSNLNQIKKLEIPNKNITSIKFSYFENCFGILFSDNKFVYYYFNEQNKLEKICEFKDENDKFIDFQFCPIYPKGFEIFMIFFIVEKGNIIMYGPIFPIKFKLSGDYLFNMKSIINYKLSIDIKNSISKDLYALSSVLIQTIDKCIDKKDESINLITINDDLKCINANPKKRQININSNFLDNNSSEIFSKSYKQIFILNNLPLTILRISEENTIDLLVCNEEILPINKSNYFNFNDLETDNPYYNINNYLIESIKLKKEKDKNNTPIKILQYYNEEFFVITNNSLYLIKIPYLNTFREIYEKNATFFVNKMIKTSVIKILKWDNSKNNSNRNNDKEKKYFFIKDFLILNAKYKKIYLFGILQSATDRKEKLNLLIEEKDYSKQKLDLFKLNDILKIKTDTSRNIENIKNKINENDFIKCEELLNEQINIDENQLKNSNFNFEDNFESDIKCFVLIYEQLIFDTTKKFDDKINLMQKVFDDLLKSDFKKQIEENIKKLKNLKEKKKMLEEKKEKINEKVEIIIKKIDEFELSDDQTIEYVKILQNYQKDCGCDLKILENEIGNLMEKMKSAVSFLNMFPENININSNLIDKHKEGALIKFLDRIKEFKSIVEKASIEI